MATLMKLFGLRTASHRSALCASERGCTAGWREAGDVRAVAWTANRHPSADELIQELDALGMVWAEDELPGEHACAG